jgi:hypothetical protein
LAAALPRREPFRSGSVSVTVSILAPAFLGAEILIGALNW